MLETATYVSDLVATNPVGSDGLAQTDDHLRLIKSVLKNTFPNLAGALTTTAAFLNSLPEWQGAVVSRLNTIISDPGIPVGVIMLWAGSSAHVPLGWHICDGTAGTPDLRGRFVKGSGHDGEHGGYGGANDVLTSAEGHHAHGGVVVP
jgi:hypothetical protein